MIIGWTGSNSSKLERASSVVGSARVIELTPGCPALPPVSSCIAPLQARRAEDASDLRTEDAPECLGRGLRKRPGNEKPSANISGSNERTQTARPGSSSKRSRDVHGIFPDRRARRRRVMGRFKSALGAPASRAGAPSDAGAGCRGEPAEPFASCWPRLTRTVTAPFGLPFRSHGTTPRRIPDTPL